ncbi:hypothetical protein KSF78_0005887 [Schistosoma japonicum]|nr:hypothetical protein KSF78_0005887 [Schistosoma japonicum]
MLSFVLNKIYLHRKSDIIIICICSLHLTHYFYIFQLVLSYTTLDVYQSLCTEKWVSYKQQVYRVITA